MDRERILQVLRGDIDAASQRRDVASERFDAIIREVRKGIPHPDHKDFIRLASLEYTRTQQEVTDALVKLNEYLIDGMVPADLEARRKAAASSGGRTSMHPGDEKTG